MEDINEINLLFVFYCFLFRPIKPNSLMLEFIYINIIESPISCSPLNLIDLQFDTLFLRFSFLSSLSIMESYRKGRKSLAPISLHSQSQPRQLREPDGNPNNL